MIYNSQNLDLMMCSLEYSYDTEIIPAKIEQGEKIDFFADKYFSDGKEKVFGTDYGPLAGFGKIPMDNFFKVRGFSFDFEFSSPFEDINKICRSSYIVFIVGGQILGFQGPLKWFSWIVEKPILDLCNIEMSESTNFKLELRFTKREELSNNLKFQMITKYDRCSKIL